MNTAQKQLRNVQARYKRHFDAPLRHTNGNVSPVDFFYVETTLADQPHESASVTNDPFPVAASDPQTITIQRSENSIEKISRSRAAKTTSPGLDPIPKSPCAINNHSRVLDLPTRRHSRTPASHGSTLKGAGTGGTPASFDDLSRPLHDVEYYRALDRAKFLK